MVWGDCLFAIRIFVCVYYSPSLHVFLWNAVHPFTLFCNKSCYICTIAFPLLHDLGTGQGLERENVATTNRSNKRVYKHIMCFKWYAQCVQDGCTPYSAPSSMRISHVSQASSQYSLLNHPISNGWSRVAITPPTTANQMPTPLCQTPIVFSHIRTPYGGPMGLTSSPGI